MEQDKWKTYVIALKAMSVILSALTDKINEDLQSTTRKQAIQRIHSAAIIIEKAAIELDGPWN